MQGPNLSYNRAIKNSGPRPVNVQLQCQSNPIHDNDYIHDDNDFNLRDIQTLDTKSNLSLDSYT